MESARRAPDAGRICAEELVEGGLLPHVEHVGRSVCRVEPLGVEGQYRRHGPHEIEAAATTEREALDIGSLKRYQ